VFILVLTSLNNIFSNLVSRGGILRTKSRSTTSDTRRGTIGADLTVKRGAFTAYAASCSRQVNRRGKSFASLKAEGSFLYTLVSTEL
jgi:hypothetical protein